MENVKNDNTQAIVINSGNANSCTGSEGLKNAEIMVETAARCLNLSPKEVLVSSTGALGIQLPMDIITPGIEKACALVSVNGGIDATEAILTTDTKTKTAAVEFEAGGKRVTMAGMAKGTVMVHPNMGTNLVFIVTDANITKELLHRALKDSIDSSFNMISIDGDTSTNDTAAILANGASGSRTIDSENENYREFSKALNVICTELAKMVAMDGDGSTKFMEVEVINAKTLQDARKGARAIVSSNIVKCELFGSSLKWTTIACVLGYSGIDIRPEDFDIYMGNSGNMIEVVKAASEVNYNKALLDDILCGNFIKILIDLKNGTYCATAWGCDLTYDYVKANAYPS
jgi:glutamate N-acetyltransferase/amino-acid N-acetyltransferase